MHPEGSGARRSASPRAGHVAEDWSVRCGDGCDETRGVPRREERQDACPVELVLRSRRAQRRARLAEREQMRVILRVDIRKPSCGACSDDEIERPSTGPRRDRDGVVDGGIANDNVENAPPLTFARLDFIARENVELAVHARREIE